MKFTVRICRPRNPLVAPSRARHAGRHARGEGAQRQQSKHLLRRELDRLKPGP
jgi:hypothetical protein